VNKTDYKDMWVFIERDGDSVLPVSLELCSETRRLCDASGEKLVAVIVGSISDGELQRVLDCGVDKIIHVTGTGYDYFNNDAYTNLFTVLCRKYRPTAVMVGGTINGRDFAPRFAARLGTGCTSDATELVWDPGTTDIEFVEPAVGGKMMAVITVPVARPQVGTIRPGTFKCVPCGARAHEVIEEHIDFPVADIRTEILDFRADDLDESLNIADADVIVLGPGSLYTSIIPNFLVDGISEAVSRAQALKCYVLNIMTQDGETDGYTAADHIKAIFAHAGEDVMDVCIANNRKVSAEFLEPYRKEGVEQILATREEVEQLGVALREFPVCTPGRYIRHNPDELARAILSVWQEFRTYER